ncbi:MAG: hypothetical protein AB7I50_17575 [Vicinamibacterales bacterium]
MRRGLQTACVAWLLTRLLLVVIGLPAAEGQMSRFGLPPPPEHFTTPRSPWLAMWARWDAAWYLDIASRGYTAPLPVGTADVRANFFPALPLSIRVLTRTAISPAAAGVLLSNAGFVFALAALYEGVRRRYSDAVASRLVWLYAVFPTSFFLSAVYAESLLLAALALGWWARTTERWHVAGLTLGAAALTRPTGIIAAVVFVSAAALRGRRAWPAVAWPACGVALYLLGASLTFGDALATFHSQEATRAPVTWPWVALITGFREGLSWNSYDRPLLDGLLSAAAVLALPFVFTSLGWFEGCLASALVLVPLSSGLISFSRLVLPAFPLFVLAALHVRGRIATSAAVVCFALQALLFAWFAAGGWIA